MNGTKVHEVKILNLGNEVTSVRTELDSAQRALSEVREELAATLHELAEQKVKNDVSDSAFLRVNCQTTNFVCRSCAKRTGK